MAAVVLSTAPAASAQTTGTCSYGSGGPQAGSLCWFDMAAYNDATARSASGQEMSINLPGGYVASFTMTSRPVAGATTHAGVESRATPLEERFAFGSNGADGGYRGVLNSPALYSLPGAGVKGVDLTLSDIEVVDSAGQPVTGYRFVIADAENNIAGEDFTWTSDQPLDLIGVLNDDAPAGCNAGVPLSGVGTTTVVCDGSGAEPGPPNPRYDGVVVGADTPSTIGLSMTTFARSGVTFAIQTSRIQVTKSVVGRTRASDSFDVTATSPEGTTIATASTGSANSATTGELTVLPRTTGANYTLSEAVTPGSGTLLANYSQDWACTNNGLPDASLPLGPGTSVAVSPEVGDDIECTITNTQLPADLSITKADTPDPVQPGAQLTYTLTVANGGPSAASGVTVSDDLPGRLTLVSATPEQGTCTSTDPVSCDLGQIASGDDVEITIVADVASGPPGGLISNTASVDGAEPDTDPGDDSDTEDTTVLPSGDLALDKSATPPAPNVGDALTYTLQVTNNGPDASPGASLTDNLPAGLAYNDAGSTPACSAAGQLVTCPIGALALGGSETVTIATTVLAPAASTLQTNDAIVTGQIHDTDTNNNRDSVTTPIPPMADLSLTKTVSPASTTPGATLTYTLVARNAGPSDSDPTTIIDSLPSALSYDDAASDSRCDAAGQVVTCDLGLLAASADTTVTIVARVAAGANGPITNGARVTGSEPDPRPNDDVSAATASVGPPAADESRCFFGNKVTILGTNEPETIVGTPGRDVIKGRRGNDTILGLEGDDLICGGRGDDLIKGGPGDDRVKGSLGDDRIRGNLGNDWLRGAPGDDVITGRRGNDVLMGNNGDDRLRGRQGNDFLLGGPGRDWGSGGPGLDRAIGLDPMFSVES